MLYYLSGNRSRPLAPPMVFNDTDREFILSNKTIILQSKKKLMERSILRATRFKHTSRECPFFLPPLLSASLKAARKNSKWTPADAGSKRPKSANASKFSHSYHSIAIDECFSSNRCVCDFFKFSAIFRNNFSAPFYYIRYRNNFEITLLRNISRFNSNNWGKRYDQNKLIYYRIASFRTRVFFSRVWRAFFFLFWRYTNV